MSEKKVIYKEPKGYFNADMKKAAAAWEKENAKKGKEAAKSSKKK